MSIKYTQTHFMLNKAETVQVSDTTMLIRITNVGYKRKSQRFKHWLDKIV